MGKYVSYLNDNVLFTAIDKLYLTYLKSYAEKSWAQVKKNTLDPFKFLFDTSFLFSGDAEEEVANEIVRQNDKTINNAVGDFHQFIIASLPDYIDVGSEYSCDVRNKDKTVFAEIKNKHNTMNARSKLAVFNALETISATNKKAICYLVVIVTKDSFDEIWSFTVDKSVKRNERVHRISADKFYAIATGKPSAFKELCANLPRAIDDYLSSKTKKSDLGKSKSVKAYKSVEAESRKVGKSVPEVVFDTTFKKHFDA